MAAQGVGQVDASEGGPLPLPPPLPTYVQYSDETCKNMPRWNFKMRAIARQYCNLKGSWLQDLVKKRTLPQKASTIRKGKRELVKPNGLVEEYDESLYKAPDFPQKLGKKSLGKFGGAYNVFEPYINKKKLAIKEESEDINLEDEGEDGYVDNLNMLLTAMRMEHLDSIPPPSDKQSTGTPRMTYWAIRGKRADPERLGQNYWANWGKIADPELFKRTYWAIRGKRGDHFSKENLEAREAS